MVEKHLCIYIPHIIIHQSILFLKPPDRVDYLCEQIIFIMLHIFQYQQLTYPFNLLLGLILAMFTWHKAIFFPMDQQHGTFDSPDPIYIPEPFFNDAS
jgi:hypothetical protein